MNPALWEPIPAAVRRMYEAFPYPRYPLLAKPRWQDGYLTSSWFAGKLFADVKKVDAAIHQSQSQFVKRGRTILVAGSGETLPYVIRQFEPADHRVLCVDLSANNLRRARFRLFMNLKKTEFVRSDIDLYLQNQAAVTGPYSHIDAYGVLHHLSDPTKTLSHLVSHMSSFGTMRVMVYNTQARSWIRNLHAAFHLMKLDPYLAADRATCRSILEKLADMSPAIAQKMRSMASTISNDSRLVDTFFHAREARLSVAQWSGVFHKVGLTPYGLFDRYGELDDLPNPLWQTPSFVELDKRATNRQFENNLELFLHKSNIDIANERKQKKLPVPSRSNLLRYYLRLPPHMWFSFPETYQIPMVTRLKLWVNFLQYTANHDFDPIDKICAELNHHALKRLARLGAVLPGQLRSQELKAIALEPLSGETKEPKVLDKIDFRATAMPSEIEAILYSKGFFNERRLKQILLRLIRAQDFVIDTHQHRGPN